MVASWSCPAEPVRTSHTTVGTAETAVRGVCWFVGCKERLYRDAGKLQHYLPNPVWRHLPHLYQISSSSHWQLPHYCWFDNSSHASLDCSPAIFCLDNNINNLSSLRFLQIAVRIYCR